MMRLSNLTFSALACLTILGRCLSFTGVSSKRSSTTPSIRRLVNHCFAVSVQLQEDTLVSSVPVISILDPLLNESDFGVDQEANSDPNPLIEAKQPIAVVTKKTNRKGPTLQAWRRRLVTKQDKLSLHKISSAGFVISSTAILAGMLIPNESGQFLQDIRSWLAPFDSLFAISATVQGLVAVPMVLKHRKIDPEVGKTQIEMGFQSILMALYSTWESPFCSSFMEDHWKLIFGSLIVGISSLDFEASFSDFDKIQERMNKIGVREDDSFMGKVSHFFCFRAQFLIGSMANLVFLANLANPMHDRTDWIQMIETGYGLPFCSGADMPLIYFSTVLSSTIIAYQSLLATLSNKKLIPAETATSIISGSTGVIAFALGQLLFARSLYG